jgi:hypothetical protein
MPWPIARSAHAVPATDPAAGEDFAAACTDGWARAPDGGFYRLKGVDLLVPLIHKRGGVYVAGFGGRRLVALAVGHSPDIGRSIAELALHPKFQDFERFGELRVSWRAVPTSERPGMVRYLHERLHPVLDEICPMAAPVPVALPAEFGGASAGIPPSEAPLRRSA